MLRRHPAGRSTALRLDFPLCNSSLVFDRRASGGSLTFGTTGNLRRADLVMWDRQTETWWQQLTGEAVVGRLTGTRLTILDSQTLSFAGFRRPYGRNPYEGYDEPDLFDGTADDRLPPKERVLVVTRQNEAIAVPFSRLRRGSVMEVDTFLPNVQIVR